MYRLLIVTENQTVEDMFGAMTGWETMGFKPPRIRATCGDALECMRKHAIDAIAIDDSSIYDELRTHISEKCPTMLRFPIMDNAEDQWRIIRELDRMLGSLYADRSNDYYDLPGALVMTQEKLIKSIVCGLIPSEKEQATRLFMLRCMEKTNVPCILARLGMDADDPFLTSRWHYGSDRLEVALRNFFGNVQDGMRLHVAVISPEEVRVLCYPADETSVLMEKDVADYVKDTVEQIGNYLGLEMNILELRPIPGLSVFANA
ncbi:MAG: hypothetical protein E7331_12140 [Clostridiales bacterium]|nr:hypothetical protein [Clostridiales bacterium]